MYYIKYSQKRNAIYCVLCVCGCGSTSIYVATQTLISGFLRSKKKRKKNLENFPSCIQHHTKLKNLHNLNVKFMLFIFFFIEAISSGAKKIIFFFLSQMRDIVCQLKCAMLCTFIYIHFLYKINLVVILKRKTFIVPTMKQTFCWKCSQHFPF